MVSCSQLLQFASPKNKDILLYNFIIIILKKINLLSSNIHILQIVCKLHFIAAFKKPDPNKNHMLHFCYICLFCFSLESSLWNWLLEETRLLVLYIVQYSGFVWLFLCDCLTLSCFYMFCKSKVRFNDLICLAKIFHRGCCVLPIVSQ